MSVTSCVIIVPLSIGVDTGKGWRVGQKRLRHTDNKGKEQCLPDLFSPILLP